MDDDWETPGDNCQQPATIGVATEGGKKFSAGRGFKAASNDDEWGSSVNNTDNGGGGGWSDIPAYDSNNRDSRGGRRGRGGDRGGGGRGVRGGGRDGGYNNDRNRDNNGWGGNKDNDGESGGWSNGQSNKNGWGNDDGGDGGDRGDRRGGRGGGRGRGRGRGGGGFGGDDRGDSWGKGGGRGGDEGGDSWGSGGGGGRGGRGGNEGGDSWGGGGRGGGGRDGGDGGENGEEKKREIYVPVERTNDEDIFTTTITSGVNFMKLNEIDVNVTGENVPPAISSFESSGLRPHLLENITKSGYTKPTPIQKHAIPIVMGGRDLMGCAQTGSGKTAAFLLPIINKLITSQDPPVTEDSCSQPNVVIVPPTRELAIQIYEQAKKFAYNSIVKVVVAYGGASVSHQRNHVLSGCHILVATPGRLNDFVKRGHLSFASCQFFVLDEADRMLDMGFLPTVEQMLGDPSMPATGDRQTLMFSATFPEEVQHLAGKFLSNYVFVTVGIIGSASSDVEQVIHQVSKFDKRHKLIEMLKEAGGKEKTVVFVETKRNADFLATLLSENDIQTTSIHGDRLQREREQALWDFKKGIRNILVATGVAARGLDIEGVQHVINYDLPKSIDEYVHRIGRTGRVGNRGKASSFFDSGVDSGLASGLAKILKQAGHEVPDWLSSGGFEGGANDGFGGRDIRGDDYGRGQNYCSQPAEEQEDEW